jgi:RNA polymerase sigma-70 factor (ECF subfamily)
MIPARIIDITDDGLVKAICNDDQIAFKELYKRYWAKLYIYAFKVLHDKDICEDIIQQVFYDLWNRRYDLNIEIPSAYLYSAVKHQIFNQFRKKKFSRIQPEHLLTFISESKIEESVEYKELHSRVEKLINELPEQRRIVFVMSRNEGLSNKEIASQLNLSVQTVKNQISSALKFIRNSLKTIIFFLF